MGTSEIFNFKKKFKEFTKAVNYANEKLSTGDDPALGRKYRINIAKKYGEPLDEAWDKLTEQEQIKYLSVYNHTKEKEM